MADIVWGSPARLFCLGFFLAGLGVFIKLASSSKK